MIEHGNLWLNIEKISGAASAIAAIAATLTTFIAARLARRSAVAAEEQAAAAAEQLKFAKYASIQSRKEAAAVEVFEEAMRGRRLLADARQPFPSFRGALYEGERAVNAKTLVYRLDALGTVKDNLNARKNLLNFLGASADLTDALDEIIGSIRRQEKNVGILTGQIDNETPLLDGNGNPTSEHAKQAIMACLRTSGEDQLLGSYDKALQQFHCALRKFVEPCAGL